MKRHLWTVVGLAVAVGLIAWLFRDVDPVVVWQSVRDANWPLLLLAVAITTATFPARAVRWRYFLAPVQPDSPFGSRFAAVCTGFMASNLIPARAGELARAYAYSRLEPVAIPTAFATLVVERFLDGVAILLLLVVALAGPGLPAGGLPAPLLAGVRLLMVVLAIVLAVSAGLVTFPDASRRAVSAAAGRVFPAGAAAAIVRFTENLVAGLASLRGWRMMLPSFAWSFVVWLLQSLSYWVGFLAFGIELPFAAALLTNAATAIASAVPSAPGYVGPFHAAAALVLTDVYGASAASALAFAFGWHLGAFVPITLLGLWHARRIGLALKDIR